MTIDPVQPGEEVVLLDLIRELAVFEKLEHLLVATPQDYERVLFAADSRVGAFLARSGPDGEVVGYAIWFENFSSFLARSGIYLEDLYVRPEARGQGFGKALLKAVAGIAHERNAGRMEWVVLDWNQGAISFYEGLGAKVLEEWRVVRVEGNAIARVAEVQG